MSRTCAMCKKPAKGNHEACEHLLSSPLSGYVTPYESALLCVRCSESRKKSARPVCDSCFRLLVARHLEIVPAMQKMGFRLIPRERRIAAKLGDVTPIAKVLDGDIAKVPLLSLSSPQRAEVESPWMSNIEVGSDALEGEIDNDLVLFAPEVLARGEHIRFGRDHIVQSILVVDLVERMDDHHCPRCDAGQGPIRQSNPQSARDLDNIRSFGWSLIGVLPDEQSPPFQYTLGAYHRVSLPDLILVGIPYEEGAPILNRLLLSAAASGRLPIGEILHDVFEDVLAILLPLDDSIELGEHMTATRWFESGPSPCAQLVWSDRKGNFPWMKGHESALKKRQYVLPSSAERPL